MIVVAIIGILGTYAQFNYSPANARLKQAARELYSSMQSARIEAVKRNEEWGITCNSATDTYAVCAHNNGSCVGANTTITLNDYGSNLKFGFGSATICIDACPGDGISYSTPTNTAYFSAKGLSPSIGYIYLQNNKGTTYAVGTTSLAGIVKIRKWTGTIWE